MPELPDLQVFSNNLDKKLSGKKLETIEIKNSSKLKISEKEIKKTLENQRLKEVYREGKELRFKFENDILGMHLMLNGDLYYFEKTNDHKNTIVEFLFDDDTGLCMTDYQGMAHITLNPEERKSPDALSKEVNFDFLNERLSKKRTVIKTLLLDQKIIKGIGNAYADEILWDAGISPFSISNKIPVDKLKALAASIKFVLQNAEKQIKKSHPDIIKGEVRDFLLIHNSKKKTSPGGAQILQKEIGGRKTYYTNEQELYK
jgi:formamidopyrimidine-DNA glycosylase